MNWGRALDFLPAAFGFLFAILFLGGGISFLFYGLSSSNYPLIDILLGVAGLAMGFGSLDHGFEEYWHWRSEDDSANKTEHVEGGA